MYLTSLVIIHVFLLISLQDRTSHSRTSQRLSQPKPLPEGSTKIGLHHNLTIFFEVPNLSELFYIMDMLQVYIIFLPYKIFSQEYRRQKAVNPLSCVPLSNPLSLKESREPWRSLFKQIADTRRTSFSTVGDPFLSMYREGGLDHLLYMQYVKCAFVQPNSLYAAIWFWMLSEISPQRHILNGKERSVSAFTCSSEFASVHYGVLRCLLCVEFHTVFHT